MCFSGILYYIIIHHAYSKCDAIVSVVSVVSQTAGYKITHAWCHNHNDQVQNEYIIFRQSHVTFVQPNSHLYLQSVPD